MDLTYKDIIDFFIKKITSYRIQIMTCIVGLMFCAFIYFLFVSEFLYGIFSAYDAKFLESLTFIVVIDFFLWGLYGKNYQTHQRYHIFQKMRINKHIATYIGLNIFCLFSAIVILLLSNWTYSDGGLEYLSKFDVEYLGNSINLIWIVFLLCEVLVIVYACYKTHTFSKSYFLIVCNSAGVVVILFYLARIRFLANNIEQVRLDVSKMLWVYAFSLMIGFCFVANNYFYIRKYKNKKGNF